MECRFQYPLFDSLSGNLNQKKFDPIIEIPTVYGINKLNKACQIYIIDKLYLPVNLCNIIMG